MRISANGIQLNYEAQGPADAPTVVMSHSLAATNAMWDPQMEALKDYRVIRYDMRGHGDSDAPDEAYSLEMLADDLFGLMDALEIEHTHYIGLSMGGMIGQTAALKNNDRFLSLSLCDTMSRVPKEMQGTWDERITSARTIGMEGLVDGTMARWFSESYMKTEPEECDKVRDMIRNTKVSGFCGCCRAIQGLDLTDRISAINVPTQMIVGEDDPGTPVAAHQVMHEKIKGSELVILPNALHFSNVEQKNAFNDAYITFLGKHS
ncbi:MAG: 3-oxoadipate enol-lactonase 2 [Alphaproteobacteria bacterium MarineAlpha4_Bin2]|nr:MAG: 3-oxoadipate enol-lactonase 2 [Alphaproteobacteria bacterium MarineAlpha4_Bin2]